MSYNSFIAFKTTPYIWKIDVIPHANLHKNIRLIMWRKISKIRDMKLRKIGQNLKKKITIQKK